MENFNPQNYPGESEMKDSQVEAFLKEMSLQWQSALREATQFYGEGQGLYDADGEISTHSLERITGTAIRSAAQNENVILGINGPGAVGKGTVIAEILSRYPGAKRLINTTTRSARATEVNGIDYHFVTDEEFQNLQNSNQLATSMHRPGRGWYGFQKAHIDDLRSHAGVIIVEEAPKTLETLFENTPNVGHVLAYLLPPNPVFETLYNRLQGRMQHSGETPSLEALQSTLGQRQLDEFRSAFSSTTSFIVNDNIHRAVEVITSPLNSQLQGSEKY